MSINGGFVYIIKPNPSENILKIGRSIHPETRFKQHRKEWPELEILCVLESKDNKSLESEIHSYLSCFRCGRRELFEVCSDSVSDFVQLFRIALFSVQDIDWSRDSFKERVREIESMAAGI